MRTFRSIEARKPGAGASDKPQAQKRFGKPKVSSGPSPEAAQRASTRMMEWSLVATARVGRDARLAHQYRLAVGRAQRGGDGGDTTHCNDERYFLSKSIRETSESTNGVLRDIKFLVSSY